MKKTIEYLIIGSLICALVAGVAGAALALLGIDKKVQIISLMIFLLAVALLIIFINLKIILILQKYGLDFYLRHGEDKEDFHYRLFTCTMPMLLAVPLGLISINLAFFIWLFMVMFLGVILPAGVRLLYGNGEGQVGEVISIVLGILVFIVFLVVDSVRR